MPIETIESAPVVKPQESLRDDTQLPKLCDGVTLHELGPTKFVVKVPAKNAYYQIGAQEFFLLQSLATPGTAGELRAAFAARFDDELSLQDLQEFIEIGRTRGFLEHEAASSAASSSPRNFAAEWKARDLNKQSVLFFRVPLFNPDRLLTSLVNWFPWIWTRSFLYVSSLCMLFALGIIVSNREELATAMTDSWRWETLLVAWSTVIVATTIHELAHGATCKKFGGNVNESGVLFMLYMPCLYCNVSDAWLIPEKWRRLTITAAGGYCDLCLWAIAVFVWRVTIQDTFANYLAFVVLSVCGTRGLMNFNPLMRLDGYYLLSDSLGVANLYKQGRKYWMEHLRYWLWGAERPVAIPHGRLMLVYGAFAWIFALLFLDFVFFRVLGIANSEFGIGGAIFLGSLFIYAMRRVFRGFFQSEVAKMIRSRPKKTQMWIYGIIGISAFMFLVPFPFYASGSFEVRPGDRVDVPSPVASFVARVHVEDGVNVQAGDILIELHSPELQNNIETKQAELRQSEAALSKLKTGARPEEVQQQESRVRRLQAWYELGRNELQTATRSLEHELKVLEHRTGQAKAEYALALEAHAHSEKLYRLGALAGAELKQERTRLKVLESQVGEAEAAYQARATEGTRIVAAEFSRRENELADAEAVLAMMKAGSRPEEIAAETARRERIVEELDFLKKQAEKLIVRAPVSGAVSAPRVREKVGQYVVPGTLLCQVEQTAKPFVEISIPEDESLQLRPGQEVRLKARALPFSTFYAVVDRIAPAASSKQGAVRNVVIVHCRLPQSDDQLKSGMTGFGRISRGWKTLGLVIASKVLGYVRTEFWW